ncbi:MAG: tetratricopeptide repeat protein [Pirellulaceae bacterium]
MLCRQMLALLFIFVLTSVARAQDAAESSEEALAVYADAANFQNNGAFDLAIAEWKKFLEKHGKDPLAAKAAHYMGVSLMRKDPPDYAAASQAFQQALASPKFELVEEALSNRGWCLFAAAQAEPDKQDKLYSDAIGAFAELLKKYPESKFADQALFYSGEAAYASKRPADAVKFYQRLIALPEAKQSPLYCDALYATGVAQEDQQQWGEALSTYRQMAQACTDSKLMTEIKIRQGDMHVRLDQYKEAAAMFREVADANAALADYALFRYAFCAVKLDDPVAAAAAYDNLISKYPESPYAGNASLAAGQSYYRAGNLDKAAEMFRKVLGQDNREAATEATHWLATIASRNNNLQEVIQLTRQAIDKGLAGFYASTVKMDLADALSRSQETSQEAIKLFQEIANENSGQPIAARALYNAAFTALQVRDHAAAGKLADAFLAKYSQDPLQPDVLYVKAESLLQTGDAKQADQTYQNLLKVANDHPSKSLWIVRSGTAAFYAENFQGAVDRLTQLMPQIDSPALQAEAQFVIGSSLARLEKNEEAEKMLQKSLETDGQSDQAAEVLLLLGRVQSDLGRNDAAQESWQRVLKLAGQSGAGFQARYRLAQMLSANENFDQAKTYYDEILASESQTALKPYALYGSGWCQMKKESYEEALKQLDQVLRDYPDHPIAKDAQLARGICLRKLGRDDQARAAYEDLLKRRLTGIPLGHALYELALLEIDNKQPGQASKHLKRLVNEVPAYPDLDKVLYELAWAMRDQGNEQEAIQHFGQLVVKFPRTSLAAEASFHVGQQLFEAGNFQKAANAFATAAEHTVDPTLLEKAYYKLSWAGYELKNYDGAKRSFEKQLNAAADGSLKLDAKVMIAESSFKSGQFQEALKGYEEARAMIATQPKGEKMKDAAAQQLRELVFLHGGQSAQQLKQWEVALQWFDQMRDRFPTTSYLPQVFYETGYCHQQLKRYPDALQYYGQVAGNYRDEVAARARFMMGEIYFSERELTKAIPEFQRVMFGFGGEKAPPEIKNWQAKSAFEAGRCGELLVQNADGGKKAEAIKIAKDFYEYVIEKHPQHELAGKAKERQSVLSQL